MIALMTIIYSSFYILFFKKLKLFQQSVRNISIFVGIGVVMIGTVAGALTLTTLGFDLRFAHISWASVLLVIIYIVAMRGVFRYEMDQMVEQVDDARNGEDALTLKQVVTR